MTDTPPVPTDAPATGEPMTGTMTPGIQVLGQFIRDFSFENPHAPNSLAQGEAPKIELDVELAARGREDGLFEVDMTLTTSAKRGDQIAFHVQLVYGGVFAIGGVSAEDIEPILLVECPRFLFPFARQIIANVTADGGFPPFRMEPLDFQAIYQARRSQLGQTPPVGNA